MGRINRFNVNCLITGRSEKYPNSTGTYIFPCLLVALIRSSEEVFFGCKPFGKCCLLLLLPCIALPLPLHNHYHALCGGEICIEMTPESSGGSFFSLHISQMAFCLCLLRSNNLYNVC